MTPQELETIQDKVRELDQEYYNGSDTSFTSAINDLADFVESVRMDWMNGRARR